jgi:hypothetical protein
MSWDELLPSVCAEDGNEGCKKHHEYESTGEDDE